MNTQLTNYKITQLSKSHGLGRHGTALGSMSKVSGKYEGSGISKEDLRQVQDRAPQGCGARDLRELEA
jgi:hypothetical protein